MRMSPDKSVNLTENAPSFEAPAPSFEWIVGDPYRGQSRTSQLQTLSYEWRVIRPGHWERAQISEMGIIGS